MSKPWKWELGLTLWHYHASVWSVSTRISTYKLTFHRCKTAVIQSKMTIDATLKDTESGSLYCQMSKYLDFWSTGRTSNIIGSTLALHCCKVHARIDRKIENSTVGKTITPENLQINFRWAENHFTFSISPNKPNCQEIRFISAKKELLTFYLSITSLLTQYAF